MRVIGGNVSEHKRSRWKKAMMDQRRENRNAFPPMDFPWITGRSPPYPEKKDKHTILLVQTKDGSFLNIFCAKKSLGYPIPFCKQSKTGLEKLGLTSRTLDVPESVTKITQMQFCQTQSSTSVDICM